MTTMRCPKCSLLIEVEKNPPRQCQRCLTPLHRCRFCLHFEPKQLTCVHPEVYEAERVVDADEARECLYFKYNPPKPEMKPGIFFGVTRHTWETLAVIMVVFTLLYIGLSRYSRIGPSDTLLGLEMRSIGTVSKEEPFFISFGIYNQGDKTAYAVILSIGRETLKNVEFIDVTPEATITETRAGALLLDFGHIKSGESKLGRIQFQPLRTGNCSIRTTLHAQNSRDTQRGLVRFRVMP